MSEVNVKVGIKPIVNPSQFQKEIQDKIKGTAPIQVDVKLNILPLDSGGSGSGSGRNNNIDKKYNKWINDYTLRYQKSLNNAKKRLINMNKKNSLIFDEPIDFMGKGSKKSSKLIGEYTDMYEKAIEKYNELFGEKGKLRGGGIASLSDKTILNDLKFLREFEKIGKIELPILEGIIKNNSNRGNFGLDFKAQKSKLQTDLNGIQGVLSSASKKNRQILGEMFVLPDGEVKSGLDILSGYQDRLDKLNGRYNENILGGKIKDDNEQKNELKAIGDEAAKLQEEVRGVAKSFNEARKASDNAGNSFTEAFSDRLKFTIIAAAVTLLTSSIKSLITNVKELDSAIVDIQISSGYTRDETRALVSEYSAFAQEIGATTLEVASASDSWLRQGYSIEEANTLIYNSMMLSKLGQIDSAEATTYLTSAMKGYKVSVEDSIGIVDKLTKVDMAAAVSAGGIAEAMSMTAVGADTAGISMDKLIGYITAVGEVTQRDMGSIGTFYKTMFARMRNIKAGVFDDPETGEDLSDVETSLGNVGIKLRNGTSEFRNFGDVLDEVAESWANYSDVQRAAIAKAFAGTRQSENFLVLMENYEKAMEYAELAENSSGTAKQKFDDSYMKGWEATINALKAAWEEFSMTVLSSDVIIVLIKGLTALINTITTLIDTFGSATFLIPIITMLGNSTLGFISKFNSIASGSGIIGKAINRLGSAFSFLSGHMWAVVAAGLVVAAVLSEIAKKRKESEDAIEQVKNYEQVVSKANSDLELVKGVKGEDGQKDIEGLQEKYERLSEGVSENGKNISLTDSEYKEYLKTCNALAEIFPSLVDGYDDEGNAIINNSELLQKNINLLEEKIRLQKEEYKNNFGDFYKSKQNEYNTLKDEKTQNANTIRNEIISQLNQNEALKAEIIQILKDNSGQDFVQDYTDEEVLRTYGLNITPEMLQSAKNIDFDSLNYISELINQYKQLDNEMEMAMQTYGNVGSEYAQNAEIFKSGSKGLRESLSDDGEVLADVYGAFLSTVDGMDSEEWTEKMDEFGKSFTDLADSSEDDADVIADAFKDLYEDMDGEDLEAIINSDAFNEYKEGLWDIADESINAQSGIQSLYETLGLPPNPSYNQIISGLDGIIAKAQGGDAAAIALCNSLSNLGILKKVTLTLPVDAKSVSWGNGYTLSVPVMGQVSMWVPAAGGTSGGGSGGGGRSSGGGSKGSGGGGGGGGSSRDKTADKFNKAFDALKHKREMDVITEEEYLKQLDILNQKYYQGKKKYLDEYRKYTEEVYQGLKDIAKDALDEQKDTYDSAASAVIRVIDLEIDKLKELNDQTKTQIELEKAQAELDRLKQQRTILLYRENYGLEYSSDTEEINKQQEEVNSLIIDQQIEQLEEYKSMWEDMLDEWENNQDKLAAEQIIGADWEAQILEQRLDTLRDFRDEYIAIQEDIKNFDKDFAENYESPTGQTKDAGKNTKSNNKNKKATNSIAGITEVLGVGLDNDIANVEKVRSALIALGYSGVSPNGEYDNALKNVVKQFQADNGILTSGMVESKTKAAFKAKGYKNGVLFLSQGGVAKVDEEGIGSELIINSPTYGRLTKLESGSSVFPKHMTQNLWNFSSDPSKYINDIISKGAINGKGSINAINIGDIHLTGVNDVNSLAVAIKNELPNRLLQEVYRK